MATPPLTISPTIAPASSTGSDIHDAEQTHQFGDINIGGSGGSFIEKTARDVLVALAVAVAARYIMKRVFK